MCTQSMSQVTSFSLGMFFKDEREKSVHDIRGLSETIESVRFASNLQTSPIGFRVSLLAIVCSQSIATNYHTCATASVLKLSSFVFIMSGHPLRGKSHQEGNKQSNTYRRIETDIPSPAIIVHIVCDAVATCLLSLNDTKE